MTDDPTAEGPTHEQVAWGYDAESGPAVWGCLSPHFALCSVGKHQSPIDLVDATPAGVAAVTFNYRPTILSLENNGHTVEVGSSNANWIEVGDSRYELLQFHFHTPSEHTVAGQRFDMEIHLVHRNEAEELAVVGVLVQRGDGHPLLGLVAGHIPGRGQARTLEHTLINAGRLAAGRAPELSLRGIVDDSALLGGCPVVRVRDAHRGVRCGTRRFRSRSRCEQPTRATAQ